MRITIKEIAEMAGVHRSTVDKVLHNRIGVSLDVRKRIQDIIDEVGYAPNPLGRALKKQGDTFRIAAVLVDVDALPYLKKGMEAELSARPEFNLSIDYYITKFHDISGQAALIERLVEEKVDGILLSPIDAAPVKAAVDHAAAKGIPVITTNSDLPDSNRMCFIGQDATRAARVAGRLMGQLVCGRGNVAIVTSSIAAENNNFYVRIREQEFIRFIRQSYPDIHIIDRLESMEDPQVTFAKTKQLLEREADLNGIYITCGGVAEVGRALKETGRATRVQVLCFEDYPEILQLMKEEVVSCTLGSDIESQGRMPVRIMLDYLIYDMQPKMQEFFTEIKILVKESII